MFLPARHRRSCTRLTLVALLSLAACSNLGPPAKPAPSPFALQVLLPPTLAAQRAALTRDVYRAVDDAARFFRRGGVTV